MTARTDGRLSVERLTVLYDAQCSLCVHLRQWLMRQRQLVPLDLVPANSQEAHRRFPGLDHAGTLEEITVIGDRGQVYRGTSAWIVCLWALAEHRPRAHWLATPTGRPFARATVLAAAKYRSLTAAPCRADGAGAEVEGGAGVQGWVGDGGGAADGVCRVPPDPEPGA